MDYYDLGNYRRDITSQSTQAVQWFQRGLVWIYAYHHEEAIACFERALENDPACAMAHWGIAYAIGPNYNKPWEAFEDDEKPVALAQARRSIAAARENAAATSQVEQALIEALSSRYAGETEIEDFSAWNDAYANAMRDVHSAHPADPDVSALFAEAMMNRTPWQLWDLPTGEPAEGADTLEAVAVLETAFQRIDGAWDHPGLLHMYIHLMEMSPTPEKALRQGDRLSTLVPDAGHLLHMATHIDVLCGEYENVVSRNAAAIEADRKYRDRDGADNFYTLYRCHNYHFKIYGAMFLAQKQVALETADALIADLSDDVLRPLADWFEAFVPMKQHVLVRFGQWQTILTQDMPEDSELYSVTTAMMRYARAVALSNTGDIAGAEAERDQFLVARDRVPETRMLFNNTCLDILQVAEQMLMGELEYHKGNHDAAFGHLRRSVELDDTLPYDEPWGWMQPARHALGALLLEQQRHDEAELVYRADLGLDATLSRACQHPRNVWSLHGLHECLSQRGEAVEILHVRQLLDLAAARADVPIRASCYCRRAAAA
ncbi:MAG: tetratricopeptide repeat protein [Alphaproteobacteria bacterium]|nr:tetratricopeptide repeat protein [Alphaproteobacteria bacterium]